MDENQIFDWEDEIQDDGEEREFVTLEPGTYDFEVTGFERAHHEHKEGGKAPSCPKAIVTIRISTAAGDCYIKENFLLYKKMEWKISTFFVCVGMKKHGEKLTMAWDKTIGHTGKARINKTPGNEPGIFFNHVDAWLAPKEEESEDEWS